MGIESKLVCKLIAKLGSIVQLAVVDYGIISVGHRLSAAVNVYDCKTGVDKGGFTAQHHAVLVRTAAQKRSPHFFVYFHVLAHILNKAYSTCNSAHNISPPLYSIRHAGITKDTALQD